MIRDDVKVYSHLPNGSAILDSKWVLGRLLKPQKTKDNNPLLAVCETHNFVGLDGLGQFAKKMGLLSATEKEDSHVIPQSQTTQPQYQFPDILNRDEKDPHWLKSPESIPKRPNLWVVKDAAANGAGGVWVVGAQNVD
ncbi:MAG: hypothetical protein SGARI_005936, partial [Bacillariaceae sp.]